MPYEVLGVFLFFSVVVFAGLAALHFSTKVECDEILSKSKEGCGAWDVGSSIVNQRVDNQGEKK